MRIMTTRKQPTNGVKRGRPARLMTTYGEREMEQFVKDYIANHGLMLPIYRDEAGLISPKWRNVVYCLDRLWWHFRRDKVNQDKEVKDEKVS